MDPLTFEALTRNPELIGTLMAEARRERARAMHRFLVEPVKRLLVRHAPGTHLRHPRKVGSAAA